MNVNSHYFDKEQIDSGHMQHYVQVLMDEAYDNGKYYNDIHIYPADCGAFIVEYAQIPWDHCFGGKFEYVDEDEQVMLEKVFPDGHYEYFHDEDEYHDEFSSWLIAHPEWEKDKCGHWTKIEDRTKWCIE